MTELSPGIYEHVITEGLADQLRHLDPHLVERAGLDPTDGHEVLVRISPS